MSETGSIIGPGEAVVTPEGPLLLDLDGEGSVERITPGHDDLAARPNHNRLVTLGLVDLQVNGFAGVDFNRPDLDALALDQALEAMLRTGVTRCLPTVITGSSDHLQACLAALDRAVRLGRLGRAMVAGFHLEGPFISAAPGYVGCHPAAHARAPDLALFDRLQKAAGGRIRLVTLAPELPGALGLIAALRRRGVVVALGHTAADEAEIAAAVAAGASFSTHLGNGTASLLPKSGNVILSQLAEDRLAASFIADGLHLKPGLLRTYIRAKAPQRSFLVSDAVAAAAASPGRYSLGDLAVERREDGSARSLTGALAGSTLTMAEAVRNVRAWTGCDWPEALRLGRSRALDLLGIDPQPQLGQPAELVAWEGEGATLRVAGASVGPVSVFQAGTCSAAVRHPAVAIRARR